MAIEEENKQIEEKQKEAKSEAKTPTCDFDDWMSKVKSENVAATKESKYGIKRKS